MLGLVLRLFFIRHNPDLSGDPLLYGAIARNLLLHGVYGFDPGTPTLIRLPGYPLFLAGCFRIFGVEHYYPVLYLQAVVDLAGCGVLGRLAALLAGPAAARRAATATVWLAALCPFTACYTAAPLTETLELFSISVALYAFARAVGIGTAQPAYSGKGWFAVAVAGCISAALLRPDGALLGATLLPAFALYGVRSGHARRASVMGGLGVVACLLAFVPWTVLGVRGAQRAVSGAGAVGRMEASPAAHRVCRINAAALRPALDD